MESSDLFLKNHRLDEQRTSTWRGLLLNSKIMSCFEICPSLQNNLIHRFKMALEMESDEGLRGLNHPNDPNTY